HGRRATRAGAGQPHAAAGARRAALRVAARRGRDDGGAGLRHHGGGPAAGGADRGRRQDRYRLVRSVTRRFLLVGLTGGLATGKSTVSEILKSLGCVVLDADVLAREVVEPGQPALATIAEEFGRDVLGPDGALDRKRLGAIVFTDPARRKRLEEIGRAS